MSTPPLPRDPAQPDFWDARFAQGVTPWDAQGAVPAEFAQWLAATAPLALLVPGCGSAYEVRAAAERGWPVQAIDFSALAVARAQAVLGPHAACVRQADFFALGTQVQAIYERAFLCALPRARWPAWAAQMAALLPPGGWLVGYFYFDDAPRGPPFGIARDALDALLEPHFALQGEAVPQASIPVFEGKERWMRWQRRA